MVKPSDFLPELRRLDSKEDSAGLLTHHFLLLEVVIPRQPFQVLLLPL